jgi:signal peptide peptidase SppA
MKDFDLLHVEGALYGQPWAILPEKLRELLAVFEHRRGGAPLAFGGPDAPERRKVREQRAAAIGAKLRDVGGMLVDQVGKVAILPLEGAIVQRPSLFTRYSGATSVEQFAEAHAALVDDGSVKAIVWDVDSPGGSVAGLPEGAARLLAMRGQKKTTAVSNTLAASAAYWIASSAGELVATPSSLTGSIGVVTAHQDYSAANDKAGVRVRYISAGKYKVEGNPDEPLTDEGAAALQQVVDDFYDQFAKGVARARGVSEAKVRSGYGEGRVLTAQRAKDAGLVDRVATLTQVLQQLGAYESAGPRAAAGDRLPASLRTLVARQRQADALDA